MRLHTQQNDPANMRFIFSLVANLTYTLFCVCIQYSILYFYRLLFFPALYLLGLSLVTFTMYTSIFLYLLCILLLIVFDIDTFRSHHDLAVQSTRDLSGADGQGLPSEVATMATSSPVATIHQTHVDALIAFLLCHITVFLAIFTVFAVCFCDCVYNPGEILCSMTFGRHSANTAIAITMLLLAGSVLVPMLSMYKLNCGNSAVFGTHVSSFAILYTCLTHMAIVSKLAFYSIVCPLSVSFSGSAIFMYSTLAFHFVACFADVCITSMLDTSLSAQYNLPNTKMYSVFTNLAITTVLLLANLAYARSISMIFNYFQCALVCVYVLFIGHKIISTPISIYDKNK